MTNQIAINVHTRPGDEVICSHLAHIYNYEGGGVAFNSGVQVRTGGDAYGRLSADDVHRLVQPEMDVHAAPTRLVVLENTANKGGGTSLGCPCSARWATPPVHTTWPTTSMGPASSMRWSAKGIRRKIWAF